MQKTTTKEVHELGYLSGESDPLIIVQEIEIWSYYKIVYIQTRIRPRK